MVQSDLRRPERWRGRVQSPIAGWSVFAGAAVAVVVGGLFWTSVWIALRPSTSMDESTSSTLVDVGASSELTDRSVPSMDDGNGTVEAVAATPEAADEPEQHVAASPTSEVEAIAADPVDSTADAVDEAAVPGGPLYGPFEVADPGENPDTAEAVAEGEPADEEAAARADAMTTRAEEITTRAEEITAKAEEIAAKAEELSVRFEGLTAKVEELEARLAAAGTATTRPAAVASPVPVARAGQAASGTRAPWVVLPQPGPGSRVTAGPLALEALARGEAPITRIHMVVDGVAVPVALERKDDKTWRGRASTRVDPGSHTVAVTVVDGQGRTGSYRWQFDAGAQTAAGATSRMGR
jgi:hypothetical protein